MECIHVPPVGKQWWARSCEHSSTVSVPIKFLDFNEKLSFLTVTVFNMYTIIIPTKICSGLQITANI